MRKNPLFIFDTLLLSWHTHTHTHTHTHMHTHTHACTCIYMYIHVHIHAYTCTCIHTSNAKQFLLHCSRDRDGSTKKKIKGHSKRSTVLSCQLKEVCSSWTDNERTKEGSVRCQIVPRRCSLENILNGQSIGPLMGGLLHEDAASFSHTIRGSGIPVH